MSLLMKEIRHSSPAAADVLKVANLHTDSDLRALTREDLHELFPGHEKFKLRRTIYNIIHKQKPFHELLKGLKDFIPRESLKAALTTNGVLVDYLHILKEMKSQMNNVQSFLDAHIAVLQEFNTDQKHQESATPVESHDGQGDGRPQEGAGPSNSTGGQPQGLQSGRSSASGGLTESLVGQTYGRPQGGRGSLSGGSSSASGGLAEPLVGQPYGRPQGGRGTSDSSEPMDLLTTPPGGHPQVPPGFPPGGTSTSAPESQYVQSDSRPGRGLGPSHAGGQTGHRPATSGGRTHGPQDLAYQMVVSGQTFGTHEKLMEQVKDQVRGQVNLTERDRDYKITFVFCPISSRIATDVEAAMTTIKDDKPVILVLMHHMREVKFTTSGRTWPEDAKVVLYVNVFYHETTPGLLKCDQNNTAVAEIGNKLLECFNLRKDATTSGRGGNYKSSDVANSSIFTRFSWR